jgi:hypothetical protein
MTNTTSEVDLAAMSDDDLMTAWTEEGARVEEGKARLSAFSAEHQRRTRKEQLARTVGAVSEEDLALLQDLRAEGVQSEEAVGDEPTDDGEF